MKGYTAVSPTGEAIYYVDRKRYLWTLSVLYPLQPFLGIWLHAETGNEIWLLLPLALAYVVNPILDSIIGEDRNNPPDGVLMQLDRDPFYRVLTYLIVPPPLRCADRGSLVGRHTLSELVGFHWIRRRDGYE